MHPRLVLKHLLRISFSIAKDFWWSFALQNNPLFICLPLPKDRNFCPRGCRTSWRCSLIARARKHQGITGCTCNNGSWQDLEQFGWTQKSVEAAKTKLFTVILTKVFWFRRAQRLSYPRNKQPHDDTPFLSSVLCKQRKHGDRRAREMAAISVHTQALPFENKSCLEV